MQKRLSNLPGFFPLLARALGAFPIFGAVMQDFPWWWYYKCELVLLQQSIFRCTVGSWVLPRRRRCSRIHIMKMVKLGGSFSVHHCFLLFGAERIWRPIQLCYKASKQHLAREDASHVFLGTNGCQLWIHIFLSNIPLHLVFAQMFSPNRQNESTIVIICQTPTDRKYARFVFYVFA